MKTWDQLTEEERKKAIWSALTEMVGHICEGAICFNDELNKDGLQARIDKAIEKADAMKTPWFAVVPPDLRVGEYILEDQYVRERLEGMCQCTCEDAIYLEDERAFRPGQWRVKP